MLKAEHISFSYHRKQVLKDVSFQADNGEMLGFIGKNGCGKSTLLSIMSGALPCQGGLVTYDGHPLFQKKKELSKLIGFVPQLNPLFPELSVKDNLALFCLPDKKTRSESEKEVSAGDLFSSLELTEVFRTPVRKLSEGMKKRVSIASVLQNHPSILILDEPTAALDLPCKELIHSVLLDFLSKGGIALMTTHEEPDFFICDHLFVLKNGILSSVEKNQPKNQLIQQM